MQVDLSDADLQRLACRLRGGRRWFRGVYSRDQLPTPLQPGAYFVNLQGAQQGDRQGTHWTLLAVDPRTAHYFDSYGAPPPLDVERAVGNRVLEYSRQRLQELNATSCGYYALYMAYLLFAARLNWHAALRNFSGDPKKNEQIVRGFFKRVFRKDI